MNRSYRVLQKGRKQFGEHIKATATKIVRIVTDDVELFGYLLRDDEKNQVRVGVCQGFVSGDYEKRRDWSDKPRQNAERETWELSRYPAWAILAVDRKRIKSMTERN